MKGHRKTVGDSRKRLWENVAKAWRKAKAWEVRKNGKLSSFRNL